MAIPNKEMVNVNEPVKVPGGRGEMEVEREIVVKLVNRPVYVPLPVTELLGGILMVTDPFKANKAESRSRGNLMAVSVADMTIEAEFNAGQEVAWGA